MKKQFTALTALALGGMAYAGSTYAQLSTSTADTIVKDTVSDISSVLGSSLPVIFTLVAALIGLFFAIRQVRKWIGRGR